MVYYKTSEEVELIRQSCLLVSKVLEHVAKTIKPGMKGEVIDKQAEELIRDHGAEPGFKGYRGFPATLCVSANESVVHGIPGNQQFADGDIVSVDCGVFQNGFFGDAAYTFAIGDVSEEILELMRVTRESLYLGIGQAVVGKRLGDIGHAIQENAERKHNYGVVRELVGHGIGKSLHESPEVPNYGRRGTGPMLKDGLVIAIEPMINLGRKEISQLDDGWTVITRDKKASAHFEHTVVVRKGEADILSNHSLVELAVKNNPELKDISEKN
ncbi:MAG: type I methionyl aminopeptidase [Bacteroidetes bacterium]|nr:MAG: type I methionyl aminopeptidase [Bacteroidota bacterium]